jgi:hypothetical protein
MMPGAQFRRREVTAAMIQNGSIDLVVAYVPPLWLGGFTSALLWHFPPLLMMTISGAKRSVGLDRRRAPNVADEKTPRPVGTAFREAR